MRRWLFPTLLIICLALVFIAYLPGLNGPFVFDDTPNITKNPAIAITDLSVSSLKQAMLSGSSGLLNRQISMLSFALNYLATGFDPFYFKVTNLAIHSLTGLGLFILTTLLLAAYRKRFQPNLSASDTHWISLAVAAAWLLHPLNLTSVLYVVQRMTSLAAFFTVCGLIMYTWGRIRLNENKSGVLHILSSILVCMPLAILCKENGALLPLLILVIEVTLFNFQSDSPSVRRFVIGFFVATTVIPAFLAICYIALHPQWLPSMYISRDFTLSERLMTEARVVWFYIRLILLPSITLMGLFHDDIINSRGLLQPASTLLSIIGLLTLMGLAVLARKKSPLITFGILFFFAGHLLESTVLPLEIMHEHRNYLPMYGLLLPLFFYLLQPIQYVSTLNLRRGGAVLLIGLFAFSIFARATKWANPVDLAQSEVEHHPNSARNNSEMGTIHASINYKDPIALENSYISARYYYEKTIHLDPNYTNGLFNLIILSYGRQKPVENTWIVELTKRMEYSPFTVSAGDHMVALVDCQIKQTCKLSKDEIEGLLTAALRNNTLTSSTRAKVLSAKILYLIHVQKDYPNAIATMQQSVDTAPRELEYRIAMIHFLLLTKHDNEAKKQLTILKDLDKLQLYRTKIEEFDQALANSSKDQTLR